jgi:FkbM family methyltransferase
VREKLWFALRRSAILRRFYRLPVLSGSLRILSFLLVPSARRVRMRVQTGPGKDLLLDVNPRWEHPYLEGNYELEVQKLIERFCGPGVTFFDVGGNLGYYSMLATRCGARAIAFEPDTANAENFLMHTRLNGLEDRVHLERAAVFSHTGTLSLIPAGGARPHGNAHVSATDSSAEGTISVRCTTLDDFVASRSGPALIKIDVEGAESEVLKGAPHTFEAMRPLLICEVHDAENEEFICSWLERKRYRLRWLDPTQAFPRQLFAWPTERDELGISPQAAFSHQ